MPIEFRNVTHTYSAGSALQATAVRDVNLTVEDGELLAVMGHTGSGKSTLVQHMNGLLKPTAGQILVDGEDLHGENVDRRRLRQKIGLVFQYPEYQLFEETVWKDISFGPKNQGLSQEEIDARVLSAMEAMHLDVEALRERSPFELSGGQMRRVAIAGVLAMNPKVLILDEPTAGLDPKGRDTILGIIRELHEKQGVTIVMVSHSMDDVAKLATRVVVMSKGTLAAAGTPREIFRQTEMLRSAGLDLPEAAQLRDALIARGIPLPDDIYTAEELREQLNRLRKEAAAC